MIGLLKRWVLGDPDPEEKAIVVTLPFHMVCAIEAVRYINQEEQITRDDVIQAAVEDWLKRNLWAAKASGENGVKITRADSYVPPRGSGQMQRRKTL